MFLQSPHTAVWLHWKFNILLVCVCLPISNYTQCTTWALSIQFNRQCVHSVCSFFLQKKKNNTLSPITIQIHSTLYDPYFCIYRVHMLYCVCVCAMQCTVCIQLETHTAYSHNKLLSNCLRIGAVLWKKICLTKCACVVTCAVFGKKFFFFFENTQLICLKGNAF